jgi:hypothetical protein
MVRVFIDGITFVWLINEGVSSNFRDLWFDVKLLWRLTFNRTIITLVTDMLWFIGILTAFIVFLVLGALYFPAGFFVILFLALIATLIWAAFYGDRSLNND